MGSVITNAGIGAAVFATVYQYPGGDCSPSATPAYSLQISYVSQDSPTSQVNAATNAFVPALQREDGSYIGTDGYMNLIALGLDGSVVWQQTVGTAPLTPLFATADGGAILTSTPQCSQTVVVGSPCSPGPLGALYTVDQNGNVTAQTPDPGAILSWTNQWYVDPEEAVSNVSEPPVDFAQYLYLLKYYLTATDDYCRNSNPLGRSVNYVLTNKADGSTVTDPKFFVYEIQSQMNLARGGPFPGTTVDYPNMFDDWIGAVEYSGSSTQQFGIALARPNPSGAPGGQLIQIDWSRFGGNVVSQNLITFENYVPYINGVGCRSFE